VPHVLVNSGDPFLGRRNVRDVGTARRWQPSLDEEARWLAQPKIANPGEDGPPTRFALWWGSLRVKRERRLASQALPSWNQIARFLETMRRLRDSVSFAA
jgi:hypothetical protein